MAPYRLFNFLFVLFCVAFVVVDVETTGLGHVASPPREDAVLQVGMAWREKGLVKTWSDYCNPGRKFISNGRAEDALGINGISLQTIERSRAASAVAKDFWERVEAIEQTAGEVTFLAYNRSFDEGFLNQKPWSVPRGKWGDCIMRTAAYHLTGNSRLKLQRAMQMFSIPWPGTRGHDAAFDAHAALLVHEKINGLK